MLRQPAVAMLCRCIDIVLDTTADLLAPYTAPPRMPSRTTAKRNHNSWWYPQSPAACAAAKHAVRQAACAAAKHAGAAACTVGALRSATRCQPMLLTAGEGEAGARKHVPHG